MIAWVPSLRIWEITLFLSDACRKKWLKFLKLGTLSSCCWGSLTFWTSYHLYPVLVCKSCCSPLPAFTFFNITAGDGSRIFGEFRRLRCLVVSKQLYRLCFEIIFCNCISFVAGKWKNPFQWLSGGLSLHCLVVWWWWFFFWWVWFFWSYCSLNSYHGTGVLQLILCDK